MRLIPEYWLATGCLPPEIGSARTRLKPRYVRPASNHHPPILVQSIIRGTEPQIPTTKQRIEKQQERQSSTKEGIDPLQTNDDEFTRYSR